MNKGTSEDGRGYVQIFLRNARSEIDSVLNELTHDNEDIEDIFLGRLSEVISLVAKAWHVRDITDEEFNALSGSDIAWMRHAIPDLALGSEPFRIVPKYAEIGNG